MEKEKQNYYSPQYDYLHRKSNKLQNKRVQQSCQIKINIGKLIIFYTLTTNLKFNKKKHLKS